MWADSPEGPKEFGANGRDRSRARGKAAYVAKHRGRLVADANEAVDRARARVRDLIDEFENARKELAELRGDVVWAALFPVRH